jgi:hypothetical protein
LRGWPDRLVLPATTTIGHALGVISIPLNWVVGEFGASDGFSLIDLAEVVSIGDDGTWLAWLASGVPGFIAGLIVAASLVVPLGHGFWLPGAPLRWIEGVLTGIVALAALAVIVVAEVTPPLRLIEGAGLGPFVALGGACVVLGTRAVAWRQARSEASATAANMTTP